MSVESTTCHCMICSSQQGSFQLYVKVIDNDVWPNADDLVDEVYVSMVGLAVSNTFTTATAYNGLHEQGSITLQFQVVCNANYYGSNCTTFCVATDNTMGHYTCASDGSKQCLSGWSNSAGNCLTREKPCLYVFSNQAASTRLLLLFLVLRMFACMYVFVCWYNYVMVHQY